VGKLELDEISVVEPEIDETSAFVARHNITSEHQQIDSRPDVSIEEQTLWLKQDPDYPPEHYRCTLKYNGRELMVYQTVGADYPDEDEENSNRDLYADQRELLLSPEFLLETSALKANSIDEATNLDEWQEIGFCETLTPSETYEGYKQVRIGLEQLLGTDLYREVVKIAVEAELDREESEEF
jgi:hypothetical protein